MQKLDYFIDAKVCFRVEKQQPKRKYQRLPLALTDHVI